MPDRRDGDVVYAARNPVARASAFFPNDPGVGSAGDWQQIQWNFLAEEGVDAPTAWQHAIDAGAPGGELFAVHVAALFSVLIGTVRGEVQLPGHLTAYRSGDSLRFRRTAVGG